MKKILFISSASNPFVVHYGGAQRSNLLLRACMQVGEVDVICFDNVPDYINQNGFNLLYGKFVEPQRKHQSRLKKLIDIFTSWRPEGQIEVDVNRERIIDEFVAKKEYDYIVIRYMNEALNVGLYKYADKLVVDIDDSPVSKARNGARLAKTLRNKIYMSLYTKMTEIAMRTFLRRIKVSFFSNKNEAVQYHSIWLPNIPYYNVEQSAICRSKIIKGRMLFVGDLTYTPNYSGMEHFLEKIYPYINRNVELHIVGRIPDEERERRWNKINGVSVLGFVDDLIKEYAEAEIVIIPIYFGAGTCIKVLEAMQMQRTLITTSVGARGYEEYIIPDKDYLLANTDEEFISQIQKALDNQELQNQLTTNAQDKIKQHFSKMAFSNVVVEALK